MKKTVLSILILLFAGPLFAQQANTKLSISDAIKMALDSDTRNITAALDTEISGSKLREAKYRLFPSISLSSSYTRLSPVSSSLDLGFGPMVIDSPENSISFSANLQYPVFAGFRLKTAIELAKLQLVSRKYSLMLVRQAVVFETTRAYWEAVRASRNADMLKENLALNEQNLAVTRQKYDSGTILKADLLKAEMRYNQARMDLSDARSYRDQAFLNLFGLISELSPETVLDPANTELTSNPENIDPPESTDESVLLGNAFANRADRKNAALSVDAAMMNRSMAEADLYPTLAIIGNFTYANPNQRVFFQTEPAFTGTWSLGVSLSYDLGGLPSHLAKVRSSELELEKGQKGLAGQDEKIVLDVRNCLITYKRITQDIEYISGTLDQARENERVTAQLVSAGMANDVDSLAASVARLRSEFAVTNKQIDLQIAIADLNRAAALSADENE